MADQPFYTFTSHIFGKNAKVSIYTDRIEWAVARGVSGAKVTAGLVTGGLSMLATGVKNGKAGTEMIPVKSITSITTKRDGILNTKVSVITAGNTVDFRVSHAEAKIVKETLTQLMTGGTPPVQPEPNPAPASSSADVTAQLQQLAGLRDAGILTEEEFAAKKAELLARL
jgi:hypothetical protein